MKLTLGFLLFLWAAVASAATYSVGAGQTYATIGAVPWESLLPGDVVSIHGQPTAYHEFIPLTASGTQAAPIIVQGVPGPNGEPVILDGQNATIRAVPGSYMWSTQMQIRGLVTVTRNRSAAYGVVPSWITISGLTIRNASPAYSFPPATGYFAVQTAFSSSAAGLYIERGQNIVVQNCRISGCADGFFVASSSETTTAGAPAGQSGPITVSGCTIRGNGIAGSYLMHDVYSEAAKGITYTGCTIGPPAVGSLGCALKDRSAGFTVKNSTITGGGHLIDEVEGQDSYQLVIAQNPNAYAKSYVTGCLLVNGPGGGASQGSTSPLYFGYDSIVAQDRKGTLEVSNCVLLNTADQTTTPGNRWRTIIFTLTSNDDKLWAANNVFVNAPFTPGKPPTLMEWVDQFGTYTFQPNFATAGWLLSRDQETVPSGTRFTGTANGLATFMPTLVGP